MVRIVKIELYLAPLSHDSPMHFAMHDLNPPSKLQRGDLALCFKSPQRVLIFHCIMQQGGVG
jgi:hypothetical protein